MKRLVLYSSISCLLLISYLTLWPKSNVWNEIRDGDITAVQAHIDSGFDANSYCPGFDERTYIQVIWDKLSLSKSKKGKLAGMTAARVACFFKRPRIVQLLVNNGANWPKGYSIIKLRDITLVENYINAGNTFEDIDFTEFKSIEIVKLIIEKEFPLGPMENTLLHWAAFNNQIKAMKTLLQRGLNPNYKNSELITSLHYSSQYGRKEITKLLIAKGADVNSKEGNEDSTPLHWATDKGHKEIAELLIAKGADVNARNFYETTPLHYATSNGNEILAQLLITKGADLNAKDDGGLTPLHDALQNEH